MSQSVSANNRSVQITPTPIPRTNIYSKNIKNSVSKDHCLPITLGGQYTTNIIKYDDVSGCFELDAVIQNEQPKK